MRKGTKSSLFKAFLPVDDGNITSGNSIRYLLHRVVWHQNESFATICANYVQYVKRYYGTNAIVIFDGYPTDPADKSTKSAERFRRSRKQNSAEINFDEPMNATVSQENFLSNETNKNRLIAILQKKFDESHFVVMQVVEDADTLSTQRSVCHHMILFLLIGCLLYTSRCV